MVLNTPLRGKEKKRGRKILPSSEKKGDTGGDLRESQYPFQQGGKKRKGSSRNPHLHSFTKGRNRSKRKGRGGL